MPKKILFITRNKNKIAEARAITGLDISAQDLEIPEIQSLSVEEVAKAKALAAFQITQKPVIVDDTGLTIKAWNGLPGALIVWFLEAVGTEGLLKLLTQEKNRRASVATCIAYADKTGVFSFSGKVSGTIAKKSKGVCGFGYDPIFIPQGQTQTYAQMTAEEKNGISMRQIALLKLKKFLNKKS